MAKIKDILREKGHSVFVINSEQTVYEALEELIGHNVGALIVLDAAGKLCGMFSERDYTRKVALRGRSSRDTQVKEIMSATVFTVTPEHDVSECMELMTDKRIRHLPVVSGDQITGLVSIGDLVKTVIRRHEETIESLRQYMYK